MVDPDNNGGYKRGPNTIVFTVPNPPPTPEEIRSSRLLLAYLDTTSMWADGWRIKYPNSMIAALYLLEQEQRGSPGAKMIEFEVLYRQYYSRATVHRMLRYGEARGALRLDKKTGLWQLTDEGRNRARAFLKLYRERVVARGVSI